MAKAPVDKPSNYDPKKPNHMIFWLDAHIGNPNEYTHLKKAFGSNTDPRHETWTMLTDKEYTNILVDQNPMLITFEGVLFLLQAFNNEDDCLKAFEKNQDKHIFFITSGAMGKEIVPKIIERYRNVFTDPITDTPYRSVYVFCLHIKYHVDWAMDYIDYIHIFDFEEDLLQRMTRDIAEYFVERGRRIRQDNDLEGALQCLHWAKRLFLQYDKMEQGFSTDNPRQVVPSQGAKEVDELIAEFEAILLEKSLDSDRENNDDDDDEKVGEACD